jgi:hypothetical protein
MTDNTSPAKNDRIQNAVLRCLEEGRYRFSIHVIERMHDRFIAQMDIKEVLLKGRREKRNDRFDSQSHRWGYAYRGQVEDGRELRVVVSEARPGLLIVTVVDLTS